LGLLLVKLPLGLIALVMVGSALLLGSPPPAGARVALGGLLILLIAYLTVLAFSATGYAGVRHVLPAFPPLALLGGHALARAVTGANRWTRAVVGLAFMAALVSGLPEPRVWEYHNELVGGTANAYRSFHNEGLDLGLRTKEIARYVRERLMPGEKPYIMYFMSDFEEKRRGLDQRRSWGEDGTADGGYTGTFLIEVGAVSPAAWFDVPALRSTPPVERLGNVLVYRGQLSLPEMRAFSLYYRALDSVYATTPDLPKARAMLAESARLDPATYFVSLELGNVLARLGEREAAIEAYEVARRHAPPADPIGGLLADRIERLRTEDAVGLPPLRNPDLE
jgi:hypothetical protein